MRALLVAALLLIPSPALAYFTSTEYASVASLSTASANINSAWLDLDDLVDESNTTNRSAISNIWAQMVTAERQLGRGISYMFSVDPDTGVVCAVRATCVTAAKTAIAAVHTALTSARTSFTSCASGACSSGQTAGFKTNAGSGASFLGAALTAVSSPAWNATLSYTNPWTPWYPRVIGPHGNFDDAVFSMVQGIQVGCDGMESMRQAWDWVTNGETIYSTTEFQAFGRVLFRIGTGLIPKMTGMMLRYNVISTSDTTTTPFRLIGNGWEFVISSHSASQSRTHTIEGLPYHVDQLGSDSFETLARAMGNGSITRPVALEHFITGWHKVSATAWMYSDGSGWDSFKFPSDSTLISIRANPDPSVDPHGPPVSYYQE